MAKKRASKKQNRLVTIATLVVVVIALGYYLRTGSDPLGLFSELDVEQSFAPVAVEPLMVGSGGDWWQVYFTNPDRDSSNDRLSGSIAEKLIEQINQAEESIYIASFEFNLTPVAEALIAAQERGVQVLWITDDEHGIDADEEEGHGQFEFLEDAGIEVRDDARSALMHNKFWIFDRKRVWTGSTNITQNGIFRNNNNVIVVNSPTLADIYLREFEEMWDGEFGPTSPSTLGQQSLSIEGSSVQVLFGAEDEVIQQLVPLINQAQSSIRFMAFAFTEDSLGEAVLGQVRAGLDVQGIFETRGSETEFSEMGKLYCEDVLVKQDGNPRTFHHKVFILDEQTVVTGSFNFSENADSGNDENLLVIANTDIAQEYLAEFERRWAEGEFPTNDDIRCP